MEEIGDLKGGLQKERDRNNHLEVIITKVQPIGLILLKLFFLNYFF